MRPMNCIKISKSTFAYNFMLLTDRLRLPCYCVFVYELHQKIRMASNYWFLPIRQTRVTETDRQSNRQTVRQTYRRTDLPDSIELVDAEPDDNSCH